MTATMFNMFKKPTGQALRKSQLEEAERCLVIFRVEEDRMRALANMYQQQADRLRKEIAQQEAVKEGV